MVDRYFTLASILLITVLVGLCAGTFYRVVKVTLGDPGQAITRTSSTAFVEPQNEQKKDFGFYNDVARRNLFRVSAEAPKAGAGPIDLTNLDKTELQLTLWGTISGGGNLAWAIIEDKKTKGQSLYKVGDTIQNATLTHVFRNKVVLNVDGKDQVLETAEGAGGPGEGGPGGPEGPPGGVPNRINVSSTMIDESMKDINKLMKDVRIRPHFNNGAADGLIISGIRGDSPFKQLGLRNGDIIQGVDGAKIESVEDAMKLYNGLKNKQRMKVEVKRRGQVQTLDFDIK
jgi:general secretion pathway protein C